MRCGLVIGTLIAHPCGQKTTTRCSGCQVPTCDGHTSAGQCWRCAGQWTEPRATVSVSWEEMMGFTDEEAAMFTRRGGKPGEGLHSYDS